MFPKINNFTTETQRARRAGFFLAVLAREKVYSASPVEIEYMRVSKGFNSVPSVSLW